MYYFTHWEAQPNRRKKSRTKRKKLSQFFIFTLLCGASKGFMKALWRPMSWWFLVKTQNKYIVKNHLLHNNYWWLLPPFRQVLHTKLPLFSEINPVPPLFFYLESFLWKGPWQSKLEKNMTLRFWAKFLFWNTCKFRSYFRINS